MSKVTIKDVARETGFAISTVSNALNDVDVLNPETKKYILEVAERMNYIPNINGKNLKAITTNVLGLFITNIKGPYYGTISDAIYTECDKYGYELNIFISHNATTAINNILGKRVDGAIILNEWISEKHMEVLENSSTPIVFLDREKSSKMISSVVFDSYKGGQRVAKYLIDLGHRRIGYIQGVDYLYDSRERFRGFKDTLREFGLEFCEENLLHGHFDEEKTFNTVKKFIHSGRDMPDAFFAANDLSAIGCIKALKSEGISVPEDVSVIGFDDIEICEYFDPPITTVNNPIAKQGALAVDRLLKIIQTKEGGTVDKLESNLVVRESCMINKKYC